MKKIISVFLLIMLLGTLLTACGSKTTDEPQTAEEAVTIEGLTEPIAEQPVLLTSVGQSADVEMVKTMLTKSDIDLTMKTTATEADLTDVKTLVLAVGGSSKGLGAAGIDADQELERVSALIDKADEAGITIIAVHIGGEARRGELSDKFIGPSFAKADYAIVVAAGDKDGMMSKLASESKMPMDLVDTMADVMSPLKAAFK
ncbi:DUF6305 family protein [Fusibacter ferrireducens]|uniref:DUF6305 domain-containing protein n=1 Tax=Fusibacter ferrireducens TaxID=2785058 RepID=A0ABR9ZYV6_9FIRM|nr:DUF6305 family protein [Fusibacter ferrireducens]MBF4695632.1 hypothetical protein [Fusibacter ferrireducens]